MALSEVVSGTWREAAACRGSSTEVFYPETDREAAVAKAICAGCVVRAECLEIALRNRERYGVWGGLTERERSRARRHLSLQAA